jgi:hypothetical protein
VECDLSTAVRICILFRRWILVAAVLCDSSSFSGFAWTFKLPYLPVGNAHPKLF